MRSSARGRLAIAIFLFAFHPPPAITHRQRRSHSSSCTSIPGRLRVWPARSPAGQRRGACRCSGARPECVATQRCAVLCCLSSAWACALCLGRCDPVRLPAESGAEQRSVEPEPGAHWRVFRRLWYNPHPRRSTRGWTGPGGSRRLQNGCSASFLVEGGFDSHAPPPRSELRIDNNVSFLGRFQEV